MTTQGPASTQALQFQGVLLASMALTLCYAWQRLPQSHQSCGAGGFRGPGRRHTCWAPKS